MTIVIPNMLLYIIRVIWGKF